MDTLFCLISLYAPVIENEFSYFKMLKKFKTKKLDVHLDILCSYTKFREKIDIFCLV